MVENGSRLRSIYLFLFFLVSTGFFEDLLVDFLELDGAFFAVLVEVLELDGAFFAVLVVTFFSIFNILLSISLSKD
jgi:hypothetical protein